MKVYRLTAIFKDYTENIHDFSTTIYSKAVSRARGTMNIVENINSILVYSNEGTSTIVRRASYKTKKDGTITTNNTRKLASTLTASI